MNVIDLKRDFHNLIDKVDNENLLRNLYNILKTRANSKDGHLWANLNTEEQEELLAVFEESEDYDKLIDNENVKKKHSKWF